MLKPVILIGNGMRGADTIIENLCRLNVPVLTTWQAIDLVPENNPAFCGRPGVVGQRAANIIQQKADMLLIAGARLDMEQMGHRPENFAPNAMKIVLDIDDAELYKFPKGDKWALYRYDFMNPEGGGYYRTAIPFVSGSPEWLKWCRNLYKKYRYELDGESFVGDYVDPYHFIHSLSEACEDGEILVPGSSGTQSCAFLQAFKVKKGQRIHVCNTIGAMGMEPMAIGAALACNRRVICVTGDGGFQLNVQELEVVRRLGLNIKYFVFCNDGYGSITTMQDARFNHRTGSDVSSGFTLPDLERISAVWWFEFHEIHNNADTDKIRGILNGEKASVTRVRTSLAFRYACKVGSSLQDGVFTTDPMEDMTPKLPAKELERLMKW